jgi:hypothetical protein
MKKHVHILVLLFILFSVSCGQSQGLVASNSLESLRTISQSAFAVGERLVYDVGFSFITAGEAVFSIPSIEMMHGRECYQVLFTVHSTPTFSFFYKVDDRYETMLDKKGIFPWRFTQRIREGKYSNDFSAQFDQLNNIATTKAGTYPIPRYVHDVVSAMFYVRTLDYSKRRPGEKIILQNFFKDTTYQLAVKFLGYQQISVDAGKFNCVLVEPLIMEGGLFR